MTLNIDQEYKALIPPLSVEEFAQLESNILRDGCLHPIVTWEETIIDGHNRYAICKKHDLPFKIITMEFHDRDAAMDWMDTNQLGRRNLSPVDFKLALGRRYNRTKKTKAEAGAIGGSSKDQNDTCLENTAAKLATQHGVSEATVKRAGKLAEAVEAHPEIKEAIASGKSIKEAMKETKEQDEPETTVVNAVKNKKQPQKTLEEQVKEEQNISLGKLKSAWIGATTITRKEFLLWVEKTKNSTHA